MNKRLQMGYIVILVGLALFAISAICVAADPVDISSEPEEDWVFDDGVMSTLIGDWTIMYNITVTNGSELIIKDSDWTFNSSDPNAPNKIIIEDGNLTISNCDFIADENGPRYYIETHGFTDISDSTFEGLGYNPVSTGGISMYNTNATFNYVNITGSDSQTTGIWSMNSNVSVHHCFIKEVDVDGIAFGLDQEFINETFTLEVVDSTISDVGSDGIFVFPYTSYSNAVIECYEVNILNSGDDGVAIDHRYNGNGSVYANFDHVTIDTVGNMGMYLSAVDAITGIQGQNEYLVTFANSTLKNTTDTGFYVQMYFSTVYFDLVIENSIITTVAQNPLTARLSGVYFWYYHSTGSASFYAGNSTFHKCAPAAFEARDMSGISEIRFFNCTITESKDYGLWFECASSSSQGLIFVENCTIEKTDGPGIYNFVNSYSVCEPIAVMNTTITNNTGAAMMVEGTSSYARGLGFNLTGSAVKDNEGPAITINYQSLEGNVYVLLTDCLVTNTKGILLNLKEGYDDNPDVFVSLINTTMSNIGSHGISLIGMGYQGSLDVFMTIENSTLKDIDGTGVYLDVTQYSASYSPSFTMEIKVLNSTLEDIVQMGMFLSIADRSSKGIRNITVMNSQILSCKVGLYLNNIKGDIWHTTFSDNLKQDMVAIESYTTAHYCDFDSITDEKFAAYGLGEIRFEFDLVIFVKWNTGVGARGASVEIMDNTEKLVSVQTVEDPDGAVPVYTMTPYWVTPVGIYSDSPYVINVEFMNMLKTEGVRLNTNKEVTIFLEDRIDPEIVLLYPDTGHVQQSKELGVRGSAWDSESGVVSVQLSLDGENWMVVDGKWIQWNLTFEVSDELIKQFGGYFVLRARAIDSAGNTGEAFAIIRVDPTPPELKVDFPPNGYITNNPVLFVRGVTELSSTVKVNGEVAQVVVTMFNHRVDLLEGPNSISVVSIDPLGNIEMKTLKVTLDTQEPFLILISPEMDEITNEDQVLVQAQVEEGLTVLINNYPIEWGSDYYPKGVGTIEYPVELEPGDNTIVISAIDRAGNSFDMEISVEMDRTPPWISVASPMDGAHLANPIVTVKGTAEPGVKLFVQDEAVETGNGYFERFILAVEGESEIILKAIDPAGNEYTEVVTIFVDTVPPVLTITDPVLDMIVVGERRFHINGTIGLDPYGDLTDDRVLLNGATYTTLYNEEGLKVRVPLGVEPDGTFSIPVDLEQGRNDFYIEVADMVGNAVRVRRTIYLDAIAPTLVLYMDPIMVDEEGNFYTHALTLNLTGYTSPGTELRVLDILVTVSPMGMFQINLDLVPEDMTTIVVTSKNSAGNVRTIEESVTQTKIVKETTEEGGLGTWFLITALIIFVVVALVAFMLVRSRRDEYIDMRTVEETPLADLDTIEHDLEVEGDLEAEGSSAGAGEVADSGRASPRPRPRPSQPRRAPRPQPKRPEEPEMTEKDLSDQGAEADIGADEIDQEVD